MRFGGKFERGLLGALFPPISVLPKQNSHFHSNFKHFRTKFSAHHFAESFAGDIFFLSVHSTSHRQSQILVNRHQSVARLGVWGRVGKGRGQNVSKQALPHFWAGGLTLLNGWSFCISWPLVVFSLQLVQLLVCLSLPVDCTSLKLPLYLWAATRGPLFGRILVKSDTKMGTHLGRDSQTRDSLRSVESPEQECPLRNRYP